MCISVNCLVAFHAILLCDTLIGSSFLLRLKNCPVYCHIFTLIIQKTASSPFQSHSVSFPACSLLARFFLIPVYSSSLYLLVYSIPPTRESLVPCDVLANAHKRSPSLCAVFRRVQTLPCRMALSCEKGTCARCNEKLFAGKTNKKETKMIERDRKRIGEKKKKRRSERDE